MNRNDRAVPVSTHSAQGSDCSDIGTNVTVSTCAWPWCHDPYCKECAWYEEKYGEGLDRYLAEVAQRRGKK